jgi:hypothetical protein
VSLSKAEDFWILWKTVKDKRNEPSANWNSFAPKGQAEDDGS